MNLTGTEKAVRVLKELVAVWDRVRAGLYSIRSIRGTGIAQVTQSPDGITIHVPPHAKPAEDTKGWVGKWVKLGDIYDTIAHNRKIYGGGLHTKIGSTNAITEPVYVLNSWEWENTASIQAGYTLVTSGAVCGDIIGTESLPLDQWYLVVDVVEYDSLTHAVISQRNDPTFQE